MPRADCGETYFGGILVRDSIVGAGSVGASGQVVGNHGCCCRVWKVICRGSEGRGRVSACQQAYIYICIYGLVETPAACNGGNECVFSVPIRTSLIGRCVDLGNWLVRVTTYMQYAIKDFRAKESLVLERKGGCKSESGLGSEYVVFVFEYSWPLR